MAVFKPTGTSTLIIDSVKPYIKSGKILDLGCGCGIVGKAFENNVDVSYSDIDQEAIERLKKEDPDFDARCGSLFEPWQGMRFNYIVDDVSGIAEELAKVSPWFEGVSCESGEDGADLVCKVIQQAPKYLNPLGKLFFPIVSLSNSRRIRTAAVNMFENLKLIGTQDFPLPKEMYKHLDLMKKLKDKGFIDYKEKFGMVLFKTEVYMVTKE